MAKATTKTFEAFDGTSWIEMDRGKDFFAEVSKAGLPIRIVHTTPKGVSTKVIRNVENAPKQERESAVAWAEKPPAKAKKPPAKAKKSGKTNPFLGALVASS